MAEKTAVTDDVAAEYVATALQSVVEIQRGVDIAVIAITAGRFMEARDMLATVGKLTTLCERAIQGMRRPIARQAVHPLLDRRIREAVSRG